MMNLQKKDKEKKHHFKDFARMKVRELGIDGAVQYFRNEKTYHDNNYVFQDSWIYSNICEMSIEYIVNDLAE